MQFPPIPSWDALHPLVIHFPIVLLLLAPLFILIGAGMRPRRNSSFMLAAFLVLLLGVASLFVASSTGEDAAELADRSPAINAVLLTHQHLASVARLVFSLLLGLFLIILILPRIKGLPETRLITTAVPIAYLCLYAVGISYLINTAHAGGRLVHEFGVHAIVAQTSEAERSGRTSPNPVPDKGE